MLKFESHCIVHEIDGYDLFQESEQEVGIRPGGEDVWVLRGSAWICVST